MTTAKSKASATPVVEPELIQQIEISKLYVSIHEARKSIDQGALKELADSISKQGVNEPLIVRPIGGVVTGSVDDLGLTFEIVAGQRRFEASKLAGKTACPCIIRTMTDEEASETAIVSNVQRENLPPLEEALAFNTLLCMPGATVESVAAKLGKAPSYVGRRLKLLDAVEPVREALKAGAIEVGHALELARLDGEQQQKLLSRLDVGFTYRGRLDPDGCEDDDYESDEETEDERGVCKFCGCTKDDACRLEGGVNCSWTNDEENICSNPDCVAQAEFAQAEPRWKPARVSVAQLRSEIARTTLKVLSAAPFPLEADLPPVSCVECPKRSGNAALLFEDCAQDTCTDRDCFDAKVKVWIKAELEDADREKRKLVMLADGYSGIAAAVSKWNVMVIPEQKPIVPCESQEEAIWVNGENMGHRTMICRDAKCRLHQGEPSGSSRSSSRSVAADPVKAKAERSKLLEKVKAAKAYRALLFKAVATAPINLAYATDLNLEVAMWALGRVNTQYGAKTAAALGWPEKIFEYGGKKQLEEKMRGLAPVERLRAVLLVVHSSELGVQEYAVDSKPAGLERLAQLLNVNSAQFGAKAQQKPPAAKKPEAPAKKRGLTPETKKRIVAAVKARQKKVAPKATKKPAKTAAKKAVKKAAKKGGAS